MALTLLISWHISVAELSLTKFVHSASLPRVTSRLLCSLWISCAASAASQQLYIEKINMISIWSVMISL